MLVQIDKNPQKQFALFNLGFRPFFLLGSFSAIILLLTWLAAFSGYLDITGYYHFIQWHSHEMIFAYTTAVIGGFLLTAVVNWTGLKTLENKPLMGLVMLWVVARILPFTAIAGQWIALSNLLFLLFLIISISLPILRAKQNHNLPILFSLNFLFLADLLIHLELLGLSQTYNAGFTLGLYSILSVIIIITGRVVPFFTRIVVEYEQPPAQPLLESFLLVQLAIMAVVDILNLPATVMMLVALSGAIAHSLRVWPWFDKKLLATPVLWVLYAGYLWLIIGFFLHSFSAYHIVTYNLAVHAWTMGGFGLLSYGMMARVTLGHTGREMQISPLIVYGIILLFCGAFIRVFMPVIIASQYLLWIQISGILWVIAFIFFILVYTKMFFLPRVDGRQG